MSRWWIIAVVCAFLLGSGVIVAKVHVKLGPVTLGGPISGQEGVLTLRGQGDNFPIFPDEETLLDLMRAQARHDESAENAILDRAAAHGAFIVRPGIKVRILERRHTSRWETVRVEIREGGAIGKAGWTFAELVRY